MWPWLKVREYWGRVFKADYLLESVVKLLSSSRICFYFSLHQKGVNLSCRTRTKVGAGVICPSKGGYCVRAGSPRCPGVLNPSRIWDSHPCPCSTLVRPSNMSPIPPLL